MELDFTQLAPIDRYKFLTGVVVPRPIAWVTTVSPEGKPNAAPFSFFNAMGADPALVVLGIGNHAPGLPKDTVQNIRATREFVVNLVDQPNAEKMNITAFEFGPDESELQAAGLTPVDSKVVKPPRIGESPVQMECREVAVIEIGRSRIIVGEVVYAHIRDELYDAERGYVATERLAAVGRMHGRGWYTRTSDLFEIPRLNADEAEKYRDGKSR